MLDKHTPVKKCIRKQQTLVVKPWVTNGIKKSISVSDKLCKVIIKAKNNQIIKERTRDLQNFQKENWGSFKSQQKIPLPEIFR